LPYELENRLVIGVASSAVFDLTDSDAIFKSHGEEEYRKFQEENLYNPLPKGIAFPFIKRLLALNDLRADADDPFVEVVLLSRNDPDTGLRVMKTIEHYKLGMTRAIFMQGRSPYEYIPALNIALFLSGNKSDVDAAIKAGHPAGQVLDSKFDDDEDDNSLRIAFDFDGVLAGDESESVMQASGENFAIARRYSATTSRRAGAAERASSAIDRRRATHSRRYANAMPGMRCTSSNERRR